MTSYAVARPMLTSQELQESGWIRESYDWAVRWSHPEIETKTKHVSFGDAVKLELKRRAYMENNNVASAN